jgi:CBS domain-containing protein
MNNIEHDTGPSATGQILCGTRTFKGVSPDSIRTLVENSRLRPVSPGEALFRPGDRYDQRLYILVEGNIVMHRTSGSQDSCQPGDFIGLANYLDDDDYHSAAIATTRTIVLESRAEVMHRLEQKHPDLFNSLNRVIAAKLRERSPDRSITSGALAQPVTRVMKSPVASCDPKTTLLEAFRLMQERKIGSMVVKDLEEKLLGVLTYSGLAEVMLLTDASPDDSIMKAACETPRVIEPITPLWEAEELMQLKTAKYLIVVEGVKPVGIVSQTDILRTLIYRPGTLSNRIRRSATLKELVGHSSQLADAAEDARETNHRPSAAVRLLSETHLMIQRRAIQLTLEWMESKGYGPPPADYALIIMGSGGRREMLLNPDQDNGIIIEDSAAKENKQVAEWFERFSKRVNRNLDKVGYMICPGEIMARNPMYRKSLSQLKKQVSHITAKPTEKAARWSNVLFDFDTLYGNDALTMELRRHVLAEIQKKPRLLKLMADHDAEGRPAIGFFNQLIITTKDEQGEWIDIKRNGLRIVSDVARVFALQNGVAVQNTSDRLKALARIGKLSDDFTVTVQEAYEELLDLLLSHQIRQARAGKKLNKLIDPEKLTPQSRGTLRMAMRAVKRFQDRLQDDYGTEIF